MRGLFSSTANPFDLRDIELLPQQQEIHDTLKVHCQQGGLCLVLGVPGTGKSVIKQSSLLAALDLSVNHDIKSRVTYSVIAKRLNADDMRAFIHRQLDRVGLGHNTFTQPAIDLVTRSADGVLRKAHNLCIGCLIEAIRAANKTIDIDTVNRVLLQPHWQKDADLVDF